MGYVATRIIYLGLLLIIDYPVRGWMLWLFAVSIILILKPRVIVLALAVGAAWEGNTLGVCYLGNMAI